MKQCLYFQNNLCQSCDLLHLNEADYKKIKQAHYTEKLVASPSTFHSRNKAKMVVTGTVTEPKLGLIDQDLSNCPLYSESMQSMLANLKPFITEANLIPYDVKSKKGELKYIILFEGQHTQKQMLRFVLRSKEALERIKKLVPKLKTKFTKLELISVNFQPEHKAIIEGEEEIILTENQYIIDKLGQNQFALGPKSFYQVNTIVAERLFELAASKAKTIKPKLVLDLYCGVGTFATFVAPYAEKVMGIEISKEAIDYANVAKELNKFSNLEFHSGDVEVYLKNNPNIKPDLIIVNPPRRGLNQEIIDLIKKLKPAHLFYSSCNPETLERDLQSLTTIFEVIDQTPFDLFTLTSHLEVFTELKLR